MQICLRKIREAYENTFQDENGNLPEQISSSALNTWLFNEDTIRQVLHIVMRDGLKIDYGQKLGKTIIFAKIMIMRKKFWKCLISNILISLRIMVDSRLPK